MMWTLERRDTRGGAATPAMTPGATGSLRGMVRSGEVCDAP